ncbi:MAG: GTP-binding protein [Candidatus Thermoplasmatota archaeon]|nr:GTP-binding protein [Candidatus Thermoplasmatota archaeon]
MPSRKYILKLCLLGDGAVGKTSLVRRYVHDSFDDRYLISFGTKVSKKTVTVSEVDADLMIWDILGQKTHESLHSAYYRGAAGAFAVCDFTRRQTVESVATWIDGIRSVVGDIPIIMLANKSDLPKAFPSEEIRSIASSKGCEMMETSAKTGENVEEAFIALTRKMLEANP